MKKLSEKEKKLVKAYAKNGQNGAAAAMKAYNTKHPKTAATIATRVLKRPDVRAELTKELKRQGITLTNSLAPIAKGLVATKKADGETVDDLDTQLKASDRALKLLLPKEQLDSGLNFNLKIDSAHFGGEFVIDSEAENE